MPIDTWSKKEKEFSRQLFDMAYSREYESIHKHAVEMANNAKELNSIWAVSDYLCKKRKEINEKYDYRYSRLLCVFGILLYEKWITLEELSGLDEKKINNIKSYAEN